MKKRYRLSEMNLPAASHVGWAQVLCPPYGAGALEVQYSSQQAPGQSVTKLPDHRIQFGGFIFQRLTGLFRRSS